MIIETKYNIGDPVWIVSKGKAVKDVVNMIHIHIGADEKISDILSAIKEH